MAVGKNIKGITFEIGGDPSNLGKALDGVTKNLQNTQKELKEVDKLLKLDPKNTELLAQKQKLLADAVSETKTKLDTLKEAEKQVQEQVQRGEASQKQYDALKREIIATEKSLEELEKQAKDSNITLEKIADVADNIGKKSEELGKKLLPVTGAIVGVGAAAFVSFNEVDEGYDTIITKTGATGDALEDLQSSMDNVFTGLPIDAETAGIAIGEVNTRFGETGETLENLSKDFIRFSEINSVDLNNSIGVVDKMMEQFGVTSDNTAGVLGLLTSKGQETGVSLDTLMTTVQKNGATLKDMGLGLEESIVLLAEMEKNGVNSETAIAGLRKAVINYTKDGKSAEEGLRLTIDSIKNAKNETEALTIASEVFGSKGASEMARAIKEGRLSIDDLSVSLQDYGNVVEDTFNATLDPPDQAKIALNNLKLAGADLANTMFTMLQPALDSISQKAREFSEWFRGLNDSQKQTIVTVAGLVAALGPALIIFGKMSQGVSSIIKGYKDFSSVIGAVKTALAGQTAATLAHNIAQTAQAAVTKVVSVAQGALNAVMALNPIALIVIAVAALVAAFILLYNKCEWFRDGVNAIWGAIKTAFFTAFDAVKVFFTETIPGAFKAIVDFISNNWQALLLLLVNPFAGAFKLIYDNCEGFRNAVNNIIQNIKDFFQSLWDKIVEIFTGVGQWFFDRFTEAYNNVTKAFQAIGQWFAARWQDIQNALSQVANWFNTTFQNAYNNVTKAFQAIGQWFAARWQDIQNALSSVATWFQTMFQNAYTNVQRAFEAIGQWFKARYDDITNVFKPISDFFKGVFNDAVTLIKDVFGPIVDWFSGIADKIKGFFRGIADAIFEAVDDANDAASSDGGSRGRSGGDYDYYAKGGILANGMGIVAEAGPELIEMVNGRAIITPLTDSATNTPVTEGAGGSGILWNQNNHFHSPKALTPYETARLNRQQSRRTVLALKGA